MWDIVSVTCPVVWCKQWGTWVVGNQIERLSLVGRTCNLAFTVNVTMSSLFLRNEWETEWSAEGRHATFPWCFSPVQCCSCWCCSKWKWTAFLYSAFIQRALQCMPLIHPFTHTFTRHRWFGCHARYQPAREEQLGVRRLAQGHFDMPRVGSNRQPSDCPTTALPPEPSRPSKSSHTHMRTTHTHLHAHTQ